ncbi:S1 family peptidase [Microbacterium nymphoidis]|uniref:S1 family peptidase n=1 Tax=Microbacterium nymphoidis TaxID=2898586 RepID=UPI001E5D58E3|nr:S1 family peptidase [Microbacterium nymphoidis]MCD2498839.1 Ig-like domain-containing protein [Microbacterium nymphoidis]
MNNSKRRIAAVGTTAGLALALVGGIAPLAAQADDATPAPTSGAEFDANAQSLLASDDAVQAVGVDADGKVVILATEKDKNLRSSAPSAADEFADKHSNVEVRYLKGEITSLSSNDLVAGAGYLAADGDGQIKGACSVGFPGWTPDGKPAFISAGHCTDDGASTIAAVEVPSTAEANGGPGFEPGAVIGELGFSQFGGPNNTQGAENDVKSVDISVYDVLNPDLNLIPGVTDWSSADSDDLAASIVSKVTAVGTADFGPIARSGRTTGYTTGDVTYTNLWFLVDGTRYVHGFGTDAHSDHGDSGGAMVQGTTAVGVLSAGGTLTDGSEITLGADLIDGLALTGGYSVLLDIAEPTVATSGKVTPGTTISGTATPGLTVVVTPETGDPITVTADDAGNWSFPAPAAWGEYKFSVIAKDGGYNKSDAVTGAVTIVPAAPTFTAPANPTETSVSKVTGTGVKGATVTLTGDIEGTATVKDDGTWVITVDPAATYGNYNVSATQTIGGQTSAAADLRFDVIPTAPVITAPENGATFTEGTTPAAVTGTGIVGATVTVSLNGEKVGTTEVVAATQTPAPSASAGAAALAAEANAAEETGTWVIALPAGLAAGTYTVTATQAIDSISSNAAEVAFTVEAVVAPTTPPTTGPAPKPTLPTTGQGDATPLALGALFLFVAGGVIMASRRIRAAKNS